MYQRASKRAHPARRPILEGSEVLSRADALGSLGWASCTQAQLQYWRAYARPGSVANTTTKARVTLWLTYNATQGNGTWAGILKVEKISNFTMAHVHLNTTQYPGIPALWLWPAGAASGPLRQPVSGNEFSVRFAVDSSLLNGVSEWESLLGCPIRAPLLPSPDSAQPHAVRLRRAQTARPSCRCCRPLEPPTST